ncbi:MAG: flagellar basal body-associated FliL family protein [Sedimentisphaerales bacterium]|nr:flagellar basal body-associated FliL family protein [Sedimentisphaerales bacterium]
MADPENSEKEDQEKSQDTQPKHGTAGRIVSWLAPVLAVVVCAGAGFVLGRLFGTRGATQTVSAAQPPASVEATASPMPPETADGGASWYYDVDPVIGNLNEPGVVRYVRLGLTLEVGGMSEKDGTAFFEQRKPLLKNWLTLYLNNLTLDDVRGEKNLRQMQTQIADAFNQSLFPGAKPRIKRILFKELSIQ